VRVHIDARKQYQKVFGFGGAFTDSAGINIAKLPKDLQAQLMRDYFSDDGIGYRVGRIVIGGCDYSTRPYSYDDNADGDETLSKFALQPEDFNYKLPYLHMANELSNNSMLYFGSAWAPPAWMKTNKKLEHGGFLIGEPGTKYYKLFAKYLVRFLQEYKKQNISLWGLTVVNEPHFGFDNNYWFNVLGMNSTMQRDFVKLDLGPELESSKDFANQKVMIFDDNTPLLEEFATTCLSDPEASKYIAGVAYHWYENRRFDRNGVLDRVSKKFPDKFFLSTEACDIVNGGWRNFELYADDIINDLNHHTSGWIDWNLVLDTKGGPNWVNNFNDAPIFVDVEKKLYYKNPSYYAMGHFSKFILPQSVRIHQELTTNSKQDTNPEHFLEVTSFERPDKVKVAAVLNKNDIAVKVEIHDPEQGFITAELPPHSLETFLWK